MAILQLDRLVLFSLFLQSILLFIVPFRKRIYNLSAPLIWVSYLLAISIANYSISLIPKNTVEGGRTGNLRVFWAPFLILHLGGPDTITALSLYDNEFWLRYASHLVTLSYTFGRVFLRYSFDKDDLWLPTALMFVAGAVKYIEKLSCLFRARLTKFRESISPDPDPGENYSLLMDVFKSYQQSGLPVQFQMTATAMADEQAGTNPHLRENLSHVQIVKKAYVLFQAFRGLFVNFSCSSEQLSESKQFFLSINAEDAFRICEVELNFAYDVFYTKSILIHSGKWQYIRHVALLCQLVSLVLWIIMDKSSFHGNSIIVTYILLLGSLVLELISLVMYLASDWQITKMKQKKVDCSRTSYAYEKLLQFRNRLQNLRIYCWSSSYCTLPFFSRWSRGISQCNFLLSSLHRSSNTASYSFGIKQNPFYRLLQVHIIGRHTRKIIFDELTTRSQLAKQTEDAELWTTRAKSILTLLSRMCRDSDVEADSFSHWITDVEYEESLVIWHIATEICYYSDIKQDRKAKFINFSVAISRYLLDLLNHEPELMPASAMTIGRLCLIDTSADARRFFNRTLPKPDRPRNPVKLLEKACKRMMEVNTEIPPREIKGDDCKSVLFDGCRLAKALNKLAGEQIDKWEVMSKVWAEFLFFTAVQCSPEEHVKRLSRGGELLTLVWMLMAHLRMGKQFSFGDGLETHAELVVGCRT